MTPKKWLFMALAACLSLALFGTPQKGRAQDTEIIEPSAFTTGLIAPDGMVNYSVIVMTGTEAMTDVSIHLTLPDGATFVDIFKTPKSAEAVGLVDDGSIAWTVAEIPADTTLGPFTVIASFENQDAADFAPPAGASATVSAGDQSLDAIVPDGTLTQLAESGSITLDAAGTGGEFVQIGETGVWILMQPDTVSAPVTLTFTRIPITEDTVMPAVAEDTWWCTLYRIAIDPADATFADIPLAILYPTRRTITPGLPAIEFAKNDDGGEWQVLPEPVARLMATTLARPNFQDPINPAVGFGSGNHLLSYRSFGTLRGVDVEPSCILFAGGYVEQDNLRASTTNGYINAYNFGVQLNTLPSLVAGPPARK